VAGVERSETRNAASGGSCRSPAAPGRCTSWLARRRRCTHL